MKDRNDCRASVFINYHRATENTEKVGSLKDFEQVLRGLNPLSDLGGSVVIY